LAGLLVPAADPFPLDAPGPLELALLEPEPLELVLPELVSPDEALDELELSAFAELDSRSEPPEAAPAGSDLPEPLAAARESVRLISSAARDAAR